MVRQLGELTYNLSPFFERLLSERERVPMFDGLDEQMKHDDDVEVTSRARIIKRVAVAAFSILAFGGLYMAVRMFE